MMKKLSLLLAMVALAFADLAAAAGAVVTTLNGTAQVQTGSAAPRTLRQGDLVAQGDTVSTGPGSSLVLKFDDGQIAALAAGTRMQVTAYTYNPQSNSGNVLLSLVAGGMRAITGLIGHNNPQNVSFRAATATIGIRGSEGDIFADIGRVGIMVSNGEFTFGVPGQAPVIIGPDQGVLYSGGALTKDTADAIFRQLPADLQGLIGNLNTLRDAINAARDQAAGGSGGGQGGGPIGNTFGFGGGGGGGGGGIGPTGCSNGANNPPSCQ